MPPAERWQPILDGELRMAALEAVDDILCAVRALPPQSLRMTAHEIALLEAYAARGTELGLAGASERWLDLAVEAVADEYMPPTLLGGFVGVAWIMAHLAGSEAEADDSGGEVEAAVLRLVSVADWRGRYDLTSGLVGFGLYLIERRRSPAATEGVICVIGHLERMCRRCPSGISWWTSPDTLPAVTRALYPDGHYNLGVAHGAPGILGWLARVYAAGLDRDRVGVLLRGGVAWLLAQRHPAQAAAHFPSVLRPGGPASSHLAWCYGDVGIAAVLLIIANAVGDASWEDIALTVARDAANRTGHVADASLCHGSAGLGHMFNRMFQATGDVHLRDAARAWFRRTLDTRTPRLGLGGYRSWRVNEGVDWSDDPSLLTGVTGTALALLAAVAPIEPAWDQLLLLSKTHTTRDRL